MCLAVPGRIISIANTDDPIMRSGRVSFGGVVKEVNLSYVPDAVVDDYVIVHVGFAINKLDQAEAETVFQYLEQLGELDELKANDDEVY
ncbi:MAG: HypC/HybG/HupF family hydrogenase formation chaperone [Anaerolineaceae bacterium]|nr:HypC/HybG/HupF family hydrogenase formation chaperone [Anaerolineaceae bacterium]